VVILLHGFPEDRFSWSGVTPPLAAAGYRVLAPDLRGYSPGARPRRRREYSLDKLAGDVWPSPTRPVPMAMTPLGPGVAPTTCSPAAVEDAGDVQPTRPAPSASMSSGTTGAPTSPGTSVPAIRSGSAA